MTGSVGLAWLIAQLTFWVLLVIGGLTGELSPRAIGICVLLWIAGYYGFPALSLGLLFPPFLTVLDIALVFMVFKGDVRIR